MLPEYGHFALILALLLATGLSTLPLYGVLSGHGGFQRSATALTWGMAFFLATAFAILVACFLADDFSVRIVAENSNGQLPWFYKFSATWGNHEGSMLLWVLMLGGWATAVSLFSGALSQELKSAVLAVMGMISLAFLLFLLITSNPFDRLLPIPPGDGGDLNPLLQDFGLIVHPPTLYMGYVGFSVAFAFAIAALITGRFDAGWSRWARPWTNLAWAFLTLGIALGSWWAYYELGWGGWWFWDPVENASFMPWLVGTALIHSQAVSEKRNLFKSWTLLLAILAFSFSLLGTFLVRSGVLTSVHAFATDPERGLFILLILLLTIGGSLLLYALRAGQIRVSGEHGPLSRESFLLFNNIILVVIAFMVLLGTLFPLLFDAFGWRKLSVGAPYFNGMFNFFMVFLLSLLAVGQLLRWKRHPGADLRALLKIGLPVAIVLALILPPLLTASFNWRVWLGLALVFWLLAGLVRLLLDRTRNASKPWQALRRAGASFWGMWLAHLGVAISVVGVVLVSNFDVARDFRMAAGDTVEMGDYHFRFDGIEDVRGPNYRSDLGVITVLRNDREIADLHPEKRFYNVQRNTMTEAGIDAGLFRDIYASLAEPLDDDHQVWAVRLQVKPFVRWIWLGALFMAAGGVLTLFDRRYRSGRRTSNGGRS
ncbi:heme lyase CcmF/NrfE family subunit [Saccharospirillum mangrovi]|uniref:heme lyase CcmF/NrfE family subunit n=1 Tax=Saccharospirillum mangrovi TaxID=2161747 RepID=UPI000D383855|nr:heme lyase CcmF/NrfE family subunit [Saccharospirillum mangrovi]